MNRIQERLKGIYNVKVEYNRLRSISEASSIEELPLSIEGQVHRLIKEATSDENLARAYIGWMPFI